VTSALDPAAKLCVVRVAPGDCEIAMLVALLTAAHAAWPAPPSSPEFQASCLVIAPHHVQIAALKSKLAAGNGGQAFPHCDKLVIDTVERMQGQQADVVLIAYGHVDPQPGEASFLFSQPRLNVAVTRARFKCVVLVSDAVDMPDEWAAGAAMAEKGVQDGVAYLRRLVRVCRQGSAAAAAGVAVEEPALGARYVDPKQCVVRQGDDVDMADSQRTVDEAAEGAAQQQQQQHQHQAQGAVRTVCPAPTRKVSRRG
jgi:AAA domain